jgi:hypothetical protein
MDLAPAQFRARERVASALQRTVWSRSTGDRSQRESMPGRKDGDQAGIPAVRNSLIRSPPYWITAIFHKNRLSGLTSILARRVFSRNPVANRRASHIRNADVHAECLRGCLVFGQAILGTLMPQLGPACHSSGLFSLHPGSLCALLLRKVD